MDERNGVDSELGLRLNRALVERDVEAAFELLAQYLRDNGLKVPARTIEQLGRCGLLETH